MITETDDELKSRVGWLADVESLGRAVASSEVIDVTVSEDGEEPVRTQAHTMMIGNCGTVQGGITLLPDADPRDGELDLLLIDAEGVGLARHHAQHAVGQRTEEADAGNAGRCREQQIDRSPQREEDPDRAGRAPRRSNSTVT